MDTKKSLYSLVPVFISLIKFFLVDRLPPPSLPEKSGDSGQYWWSSSAVKLECEFCAKNMASSCNLHTEKWSKRQIIITFLLIQVFETLVYIACYKYKKNCIIQSSFCGIFCTLKIAASLQGLAPGSRGSLTELLSLLLSHQTWSPGEIQDIPCPIPATTPLHPPHTTKHSLALGL